MSSGQNAGALDRRFVCKWTAFLLGIVGAVLLRKVLAIAFLGVLLGVVFNFPVNRLSRRIPRSAAALLVLVSLIAALGTVGYFVSQPIAEQVQQFKAALPQTIHRIKDGISIAPKEQGKNEMDLDTPLLSHIGRAAGGFASIVMALIAIIVLGVFFSHAPRMYHDGVRALVPREREPDFEELWRRLGVGLQHWIKGILVSMSIMGVLTGLGLALVGIQDWPLLALLTFFGAFIPYVGAIASAIPGLLLALGQSPQKFWLALAVYVFIHHVEGYVVQPIVMKKAVVISPALLLIWQLLMGTLLGLLGLVAATPFLVCVQIGVGYLYIEKKLGKEAVKV